MNKDNRLILMLNGAGVAMAYFLLGLSLWLSTDVSLATKGYWAMGIVLLTLSLINVVKYRVEGQYKDTTAAPSEASPPPAADDPAGR